MINVVARSGYVAPYLRATSQTIASHVKLLAPAVLVVGERFVQPPAPLYKTNYSLCKQLPNGSLSVMSGLSSPTQIRYAHTDIKVPDFSFYRRKGVKNPSGISRDSEDARKSYTYLLSAACLVSGAYAAKTAVIELVSFMDASAEVLALAKIEIKLAEIPEGKNATFKWRGRPLFVKHRTPEEIDVNQKENVAALRDPQHDSDRVKKLEWLVVLGVCTHLGCVPIPNAGDFLGGYYCPCHGSHFDASGRARKGPAPSNLLVPHHEFPDEDTLIVG